MIWQRHPDEPEYDHICDYNTEHGIDCKDCGCCTADQEPRHTWFENGLPLLDIEFTEEQGEQIQRIINKYRKE